MGEDLHRLEIEPQEAWADRAADVFEAAIASAIAQRERCLMALSGGETPGPAWAALAERPVEWDRVVVFQVDERLAPDPDERNLSAQKAAFAGLPITWIPLPVDRVLGAELAADPLNEALADSSWRQGELADDPPVVAVVQLGLGVAGHTASLLPGDPAVNQLRGYVAITGGPYKGYRRLTMTRPVLDRARLIVWLVRGAEKAEPLGRLLAGDLSIPAGLIRPRQSIVIADEAAARQV
jgi:6-phosphogluconolactonase/glucosamine-6-phosphate isomerase/deaminase